MDFDGKTQEEISEALFSVEMKLRRLGVTRLMVYYRSEGQARAWTAEAAMPVGDMRVTHHCEMAGLPECLLEIVKEFEAARDALRGNK